MRIFRSCILLIILCGCSFATAQRKQVLYDFIEIPQALLLNPGVETTYKWYAGVPLISGFSVNAGSSGLSVNDLFANDGIDFNTKFRQVALGQSVRDEISANVQLDLINIGFRPKNRPENFYSAGVYVETDFINYWPRDLAILAFEGNADRLGQIFDLGDLKIRGEVLGVYHIGMNKKVDNKLTIGARAKLYSSIINFNSSRNKGFFVTREGERNLLSNTLDADLEARTSGVQELRDASDISNTLIKRLLLGGNLGLGFDAGFTYYLNEQTVVTGSVLDVGFIYHTKDVENYTLKGDASIEGIEVILPDAINSDGEFFQNLVDDVEEAIPFDTNSKNYITFRPTKLNGSIRYNFGKQIKPRGEDEDCDCNYKAGSSSAISTRPKYANSIGGQLYAINRPRGPQLSLTAFYQRRFGNAFSIKTTYTADKFSYTNIGLGINFQAGPINLYAAADNLLSYRNVADTNYLSFQFGLNIISWGKK